MKTFRCMLFAVVLLWNYTFINGQAEGTTVMKPFGFGLHMEQFKINDIADISGGLYPANKLIFTINATNSIRFEPEIGFLFNKNKTDNLKNSAFSIGAGLFTMKQHNKLNIYAGIRIEYAVMSSEEPYSSPSTIVNKTTRFSIGPAVGCEYFLGENFTFGGELALKYEALKNEKVPNPYNDKTLESSNFTTDTGLFLRFYF